MFNFIMNFFHLYGGWVGFVDLILVNFNFGITVIVIGNFTNGTVQMGKIKNGEVDSRQISYNHNSKE